MRTVVFLFLILGTRNLLGKLTTKPGVDFCLICPSESDLLIPFADLISLVQVLTSITFAWNIILALRGFCFGFCCVLHHQQWDLQLTTNMNSFRHSWNIELNLSKQILQDPYRIQVNGINWGNQSTSYISIISCKFNLLQMGFSHRRRDFGPISKK